MKNKRNRAQWIRFCRRKHENPINISTRLDCQRIIYEVFCFESPLKIHSHFQCISLCFLMEASISRLHHRRRPRSRLEELFFIAVNFFALNINENYFSAFARSFLLRQLPFPFVLIHS